MMDTSKIYIKMCEMATEIQRRELVGGDFYSGRVIQGCTGDGWNIVKWSDQKRVSGGIGTTTKLTKCKRPDVIWLPRQDQLQEMIDSPMEDIMGLGYIISSDQVNHDAYKYLNPDKFESMEQLWLAIVMKDNFGKYWNGQDWVEIRKEK
jgi:hypothetical protein